ncbi:uncharacterized protein LOC120328718 [Styela clava]
MNQCLLFRNVEFDWEKYDEFRIKECFKWKRGEDSVTKGIWLWNQAYTVDVPEIGTHFTDHTKLYQEHWEDDDTELENSFQDLTLVVRDWENDDEYGWDKGHKHMEKQVGKNKVLKDHMKKSDSNIRCFILPHPGMSVIRSKEGKIKEIETSFVNQLLPLISKVLNPTTIKPFRIGGSIRSGRYWIDMANGFVIALQKTGRLKLKNMTENIGDEPITEEEIMRIHEDAVTTTMATFDEKKKRIIGTDKTDKQKLKECILNNVEGLFNKYKDRNAKHIKTIESNLRYEIQGIVQAYRENMLTDIHSAVNFFLQPEELQRKHDEFRMKSLQKFEENNNENKLSGQFEAKLKSLLDNAKIELEAMNTFRRETSECKDAELKTLKDFVDQCYKMYEKDFECIKNLFVVDTVLTEKTRSSKKKSMDEYSKLIKERQDKI